MLEPFPDRYFSAHCPAWWSLWTQCAWTGHNAAAPDSKHVQGFDAQCGARQRGVICASDVHCHTQHSPSRCSSSTQASRVPSFSWMCTSRQPFLALLLQFEQLQHTFSTAAYGKQADMCMQSIRSLKPQTPWACCDACFNAGKSPAIS